MRARRADAERRIAPVEFDEHFRRLRLSEVPNVRIERVRPVRERRVTELLGVRLCWRVARVHAGEDEDVRTLPERTDDPPRTRVAGIRAHEEKRQEELFPRA